MEHDQRYGHAVHFPPSQGYWPVCSLASPMYEHESSAFPTFSHTFSGSDAEQARSPHEYRHQHVSSWPNASATQQAKYSSRADMSPPRGLVQPAPQPIAASRPTESVPPAPPARVEPSAQTPRKLLTDADRLDMCKFAESNPSLKQTDIGAKFGVERSTVSKVLRNKDKYILSDDATRPIRRRPGKSPDVERALLVWIKKHEKDGIVLMSDAAIRVQLQQFIAASGGRKAVGARFTDGEWLEKFKSENNVITIEDTIEDPISIKPPNSPSSQHSSPESKEQGLVSPVKLEDHEVRPSKRHRFRKRKHETETRPSTTVSNSSMPTEVATTAPPPSWPSQSTQPPPEWHGGPGAYRWRGVPYNSFGAPTQYQDMPVLMPVSTYPTPPVSQMSYYEHPALPIASRLEPHLISPLVPPTQFCVPSHERATNHYEPIAQLQTNQYDSPTEDQATEALQTLQRYLKNKRSNLNSRELETIQQLESIRLKPSHPDLRNPSTSSSLLASPHDLPMMETANVR